MEPTTKPAKAVLYIRIHPTCPHGMLDWLQSECEAFAEAHKLFPILFLEDRTASSALDGSGLASLREFVHYRQVDAVVAVHVGKGNVAMRNLEALGEELALSGVTLHLLPYAASSEPPLVPALEPNEGQHSPVTTVPVVRGPSFAWELVEASSLADLDDEDTMEPWSWRNEHLPWTPTTELRAVIYARTIVRGTVTPEEQLHTARSGGRAIARGAGYRLIATIDDWTLEDHLDRPGLNALRQLVQTQLVDVVITGSWHMLAPDRARALQLRQEFLNAGCEVRTIFGGLPKEE